VVRASKVYPILPPSLPPLLRVQLVSGMLIKKEAHGQLVGARIPFPIQSMLPSSLTLSCYAARAHLGDR
jgi:hypothetical protein